MYDDYFEFEMNYYRVGCLYKTLVLKREELAATILLVFPAYLKVCRHLQTVYWLEPAGSHGVWCLDDYQLLPFLFGSSQLIGKLGCLSFVVIAWYNALFEITHRHCYVIGNEELPPTCVIETTVVNDNSSEYMYLEAIKFINIVINVYSKITC